MQNARMNPTVASLFESHKKLLISGPCSAETAEQVLHTARRLAAIGKIDLLRAGIWKPRTKPGMFEGVGSQGLPWLLEAKKQTGLPTTVEVATPKHIEEALQYQVDVLWIGARTTVSPFSVQELADALKGMDVPILIKNPINADVELWCGAVERMQKSGLKNIALVHRGFSSYGNSEYRNAPMWHLPIEMKRRFPSLKMICDPSHICGNRTLLQSVAQKSINLDFDGLMIESHIQPDEAWSDAMQQITPEALANLLDGLIWRNENTDEAAFLNALQALREQMNHVDDELLTLLGQRMKIAEDIGACKRENNITILQANRWKEIRENALQKAKKIGLSEEFIKQYVDAVHMESINHQSKVMNNE